MPDISRVLWVRERDVLQIESGEIVLAYSQLPDYNAGARSQKRWCQVLVPISYIFQQEKESSTGKLTGMHSIMKPKRGRPKKQANKAFTAEQMSGTLEE